MTSTTLINYLNRYDIPSITHRLNQIEASINFSYELDKKMNYLSFLDFLLINYKIKSEFIVYHKNNNKKILHTFYSNHSDKTRSKIFMFFFFYL